MTERACQTCGGPCQPLVLHGHRRKFCSDRCRKAQYDLACVDCGARVDGTTPGKAPEDPRCVPCANRHVAESGARSDMIRVRARRERMQQMWRDGMTLAEIGDVFGWTVNHAKHEVIRMRKLGWDMPYRRSPEDIARIREGVDRWRSAA